MEKKGFPESYDLPELLRFLSGIKAGQRPMRAPVYSHIVYDVVPNEWVEIDRPGHSDRRGPERAADRPPAEGRQGDPVRVGLFRFLGLSRRRRGRAAALVCRSLSRVAAAPRSAIRCPISIAIRNCRTSEAVETATGIWKRINLVNLHDNILPTRQRADLILKKAESHLVDEVSLRRL